MKSVSYIGFIKKSKALTGPSLFPNDSGVLH